MPCTIKDVARRAGLSPSTVSRSLNNSGYVSAETRRRVDEAVAALRYQPNWLAQGLRGKPSRLIGLIIPDISNTFYTAVARVVSSTLRARDYELVLCVNEEDADIDLQYLRILQYKRVDGILYTHPAHGSNSSTLRQFAASGMPIVELNRQREKDLLDATLADNYQGAYMLTEHLIRRGHQRIGLILGETSVITGAERLRGYRDALNDAGLPVEACLVRTGSFTRRHGEAATRELLDLPERPTVIFAASNRILMGVLVVLDERHFEVPEDISVVSFDDSEWMSIWRPPITCVDVAVDEMAQLAADLLLRRIEEPSPSRKPITYLLSTTLIERASCRVLKAVRPAPIAAGASTGGETAEVVAYRPEPAVRPMGREAPVPAPMAGG
jgi:LacI family transcriptional regulator, galactose operon repressor